MKRRYSGDATRTDAYPGAEILQWCFGESAVHEGDARALFGVSIV